MTLRRYWPPRMVVINNLAPAIQLKLNADPVIAISPATPRQSQSDYVYAFANRVAASVSASSQSCSRIDRSVFAASIRDNIANIASCG